MRTIRLDALPALAKSNSFSLDLLRARTFLTPLFLFIAVVIKGLRDAQKFRRRIRCSN
jgi:hypothetical protein